MVCKVFKTRELASFAAKVGSGFARSTGGWLSSFGGSGLAKVATMIMEIASRPTVAITFVPLTDALLIERFLKQKPGADWMLFSAFQGTYLKDRLGLTTDYLKFLESIEAMPSSIIRARPSAASVSGGAPRAGVVERLEGSQEELFQSDRIDPAAK
jgi:nitrate/nitrite transporter NarK